MKKVLIVVTNHATLGSTDKANGTYSPELTHALHVFTQSGLDYEIASIQGGKAPIYGTDIEGDEVNSQVLSDVNFQNQMNNTVPVHQLKIEDYDAIFYPGGFGLLSDLASNEDFARLAASHYENGGVIGAVCHGPAALLNIKLANGDYLINGKKLTGFSNTEEDQVKLTHVVPFSLQDQLTERGASYSAAANWQSKVVVDQRLVTGQNPQSAAAVGVALVNLLTTK